MMGIHKRVMIVMSLFMVLFFLAIGFSIVKISENNLTNEKENRLAKDVMMIQEQIKISGLKNEAINRQLQTTANQLGEDISLFSQSGELLFSTELSDQIKVKMIEMIGSHRGQVTGELKDGSKQLIYYYTRTTEDQYLFLTTPLDSVMNMKQQIWFILTFLFGIALILFLTFGRQVIDQYTKPIENATHVATELAKGNYGARTYEDRVTETGLLSQSINILARNLQEMTKQQEIQQDRLKTLIENMGSGLILIDEKGFIHLVNKAFIESFSIDSSDYIHRQYDQAIAYKEIVKLVEEIFFTETQVRKQLHLPLKIERKHFEVLGSPIIGMNNEWKGIVLVFHDITEIKKLEQMRKDFVANVSHELKTPITSIKGFAETLLDGAMEDEQLRESFLDIILKESGRLQSLINDLLDLSRMEQEGFTINIHAVDLQEVLSEVILMLQYKADEKHVRLALHMEGKVTIDGDSHRLKQIFINLINNAVTYTLAGGLVAVRVFVKSEVVDIHIEDTGSGMEEAEIPRIFERFYRIDKARSRNSGGTGLGLAIVKHLVEAHQGHIKVKSKKGQGTTFTVILKRKISPI